MNSVNIIGNIGHDLEIRQTQSGKSVLNFNVAISEGKDKTTWVTVVTWEKTAESVYQFCGKGSKVGVTGSLQENKYTKKDGTEVKTLEVRAFRVDFLDSKGSNQGQQQNFNQQQGQRQFNNQQQPNNQNRSNNQNQFNNQNQQQNQQQGQENPFANLGDSAFEPNAPNNQNQDDWPFDMS